MNRISTRWICPLCQSALQTTRKSLGTFFFCSECGFSETGPNGYSVEEAYDWITKIQVSKQSKKAEPSFPTKRKRIRRSKVDAERLESDRKIQQNAKQIQESLQNISAPNILRDILSEAEFYPVYFQLLSQSLPEHGKSLSESVNLPILQKKLENKGIKHLYKFQEEVKKQVLSGNNVLISAPTGLGKTEAFLLPIIHSIILAESNPARRKGPSALLIYPTKALASDQKEKIEYYCKSVGLSVGKFDGDTSHVDRDAIYRNPPDLLITNPDMIHYHLMGNISFQSMISNARFVVLDEIHLCVGSYGTNVLWIIRRIRRFAPGIQCIGASATISNARNFASTIFDQPTVLISAGTARKSDLYLTILYPKERSNLSTMALVTSHFIKSGIKTLAFGNGHLSAEALNIMLRRSGLKSDIHRAGLSYQHRRDVEKRFKTHALDVLVSTPTLELGIDIGSLDSVVSMLTSLTSFVQRIGRAGRTGKESYATLVLRGDDPISAYYARNPHDYMTDLEAAYVEPDNEVIARFQLLAMLLDKPLSRTEAAQFTSYIEDLIKQKVVASSKDMYSLRNRNKAQQMLKDFSIRGIGKSVGIWHIEKQIGERALPRALSELHEGAIYLHGGKSYKVEGYNERLRMSKLRSIPSSNERTQAMRTAHPKVTQLYDESDINGLGAGFCSLEMTEAVHGYFKQNIFNNKIVGTYELDSPISYSYQTMGFILSLPKPTEIVAGVSAIDAKTILGGTFHAIEHVLIESGNSLTGGGSNQIGGVAMGDTGTIFVYDGTEGGSGLTRLLYDSLIKGMDRSLKIMEDCPCKRIDGCPRCTYSYYCGNNNQPLNRIGGIETLKLVGREATELDLNFDDVDTYISHSDFLLKFHSNIKIQTKREQHNRGVPLK
ncbi:MAG: DEAD/DEAH box helicase [Candidatus Kariarchaeaceae archaeon]